jgi:hypothetical protein
LSYGAAYTEINMKIVSKLRVTAPILPLTHTTIYNQCQTRK